MDIEEDIKILENLKKYLNLLIYEETHKIIYNDLGWDEKTIDCINAIEHILVEREVDKKKIAEIEGHQEKFYNGELYTAKQLKQIEKNQNKYFINKQKVKDKIEELKNNLKFISCDEECNKCFSEEGKTLYRGSNFTFCYAYYQIKILQELLEDK